MNNAIIVLGMHRSGTSCLTGCLKNYGLNLGMVSKSNRHNRKGNQENKEVFQLNEAVLNFNNGSWRNPPENNLQSNTNLDKKREEIINDYEKLPKPWGIKDPRMLLTYDFWKEHLPSHLLVGTIRHPLAVVKSLLARKHKNLTMTEDKAYYLWGIYNKRLLQLYRKYNFQVINFDLEQKEYEVKINLIRNNLKLTSIMENSFFENRLKNQSAYLKRDCPQNLVNLYEQLLKICI